MIRQNKVAADFSERVRRMVSGGENGTVHAMEDNALSDGDGIIIDKIKETIGDEEDGAEEEGEDDGEEDDEGDMATSREGDFVKTASLTIEQTNRKEITSTVKPMESTTKSNIIQKRLLKVKRTPGEDDDAINKSINDVEHTPKRKPTKKKRDKMRRVRG